MMVHGGIALRLAGSRIEQVPSGLLEGLARLVATGFFHRFREVERTPAGETVARLVERMRARASLRVVSARTDRGPLEPVNDGLLIDQAADRVELETETTLGGIPLTLKIAAATVHPRGRAGLAIDLVGAPLPTAVQTELAGVLDREEGEHVARRLVKEQLELDRKGWGEVLADLKKQGTLLLDELAELCQASLAVDRVESRVAIRMPSRNPRGVTGHEVGAAALWLGALVDVASSQPDLFHGLGEMMIDGGGLFESSSIPEGGGSFEGVDVGDIGGGTL